MRMRSGLLAMGLVAAATPVSGATAAELEVQQVAVDELIVTARRREESVQDVPIAMTVVGGERLDRAGIYSVAQLPRLAPSLQFISANPRNTTVNIRGLGNNPGLANDGLEPGVGFYVDQVYFSRSAAATFDLLDIERIEVLRGPQGTLFGKNTTAGALSVTTRAPSFDVEATGEVTLGDEGFAQAKGSLSGPLGESVAIRVSGSVTERDGFERHAVTGADLNNQSNAAVRGQLLFRPSDSFSLRLSADYNHQDLDCCYVVFAGVGTTLKPASAQFEALAAGLGYAPPSRDPYDRLSDVNSPVRAGQTLSGVSAVADWDLGAATLTLVAAWRRWSWKPANDGDYTSLSVMTRAENANDQEQSSLELRLASNGDTRLQYVAGLYAYRQEVDSHAAAQFGADATYWLVSPALPRNLLDGYLQQIEAGVTTHSYAAFGQATWAFTPALKATAGVRYTHEEKDAQFDQTVSGGLATTVPSLVAVKLALARPQAYSAGMSDGSFSGMINLSYEPVSGVMAYGSLARGYKSGGVNLSGLPSTAAGVPMVDKAVVDPEKVTSAELGLKTELLDRRLTANLAIFRTVTDDYQANVVDTSSGLTLRYLDNIDKVRSQGFEADLRFAAGPQFNGYASLAYTDAEYVSYANGPCPLEKTGGSSAACDLSGRPLPGVSKWAGSVGGEYARPARLAGLDGDVYLSLDAQHRSGFYSDAATSRDQRVDAYTVVNARAGFRWGRSWEVFLWSKNLLDEKYFTSISAQAGNSGALFATLGDPRTIGATLRVRR
ncbi:TonB-dependent receptor [Phenylobacterium sp.]|uniref:TonB-dependent receptor n=1 Tax=Phenylobacterium sp. TaxID=1871053 RepID=UPI003923814C